MEGRAHWLSTKARSFLKEMMIATRIKGNKDQLFNSEENIDDHRSFNQQPKTSMCCESNKS